MQNFRISILGLMSLTFGLVLWTAGGGTSKAAAEDLQATSTDSEEIQQQAEVTAVAAVPVQSEAGAAAPIPAPEVPEEAPVLSDVYPALTDGALRDARLTDDLPSGVLLRAQGVSITKADLEKEIAQMPPQMQQNEFFAFEQTATRALLTVLARQHVDGAANLDEDQLLQNYFEDLMSSISVSNAEVKEFYDENRDLVGDAPLEQIQPSIHQHLLQQKQQQMVEKHIAQLGTEMTIALSADWIKEQAPRVLDNAVDRARGNGKPTFVNFGSEGCGPCQMMEPIREKLAEEYEGQADVVYVNVREQQMLASRYGVRGIPHLVFFDKNGKQVHTHTGFMPEEQIREWLKKSGVKGL